jgi:hypothetical protein
MNRKKRKPLDDALAENFVYGEDKVRDESLEIEKRSRSVSPGARSLKPKSEVELVSPPAVKQKESSLMDKLQAKPKEATKRFTVDLEESLHRDLSILAAETGRTKADIVRILLKDEVQSLKKLKQSE